MSERKKYDKRLVRIGELLRSKRNALGKQYENREQFIELRAEELFGGATWISPRHLSNIELGKNWISFEKFFALSIALEVDPLELFREIKDIYYCE